MNVKVVGLGSTNLAGTGNPARAMDMKLSGAVPGAMEAISRSRRTKRMKIFKTIMMYVILTMVMVLMASVDAWVNLI